MVGGVSQGSEKKKVSVGLFSTFRHPLDQTRIIAANGCRNLACETAGFYLIVIGIFKLESKYVCTKYKVCSLIK